MNLPLLLWASEQTGKTHFQQVALAHADTVLRSHVRADGSVYHVDQFEDQTGLPREGATYQGLHAESAWSQGQGWAIAGLSILAQQTGEQRYVQTAQRVTHQFLDALAESLIPPWDFYDTARTAPRESSTAAIAAYGLLRLADVSQEHDYAEAAQNILQTLSQDYLAPPEWAGILLHATSDLPMDWVLMSQQYTVIISSFAPGNGCAMGRTRHVLISEREAEARARFSHAL